MSRRVERGINPMLDTRDPMFVISACCEGLTTAENARRMDLLQGIVGLLFDPPTAGVGFDGKYRETVLVGNLDVCSAEQPQIEMLFEICAIFDQEYFLLIDKDKNTFKYPVRGQEGPYLHCESIGRWTRRMSAGYLASAEAAQEAPRTVIPGVGYFEVTDD